MKYGHFSEDGREYVVERPDTPRPWINYLCNRDGNYVSLLSANAGGYSFVGCPKDGRVTRWRYNGLPQDRPGRYLYMKSVDDNDVWSLSWQPTAKPVQHYGVRHGLGYTTFSCNYHGVEAEATYFVPLDDPLEIWSVTLKNTAATPQRLEVFPFAEMCLGHALTDLINKPNDQHFNRLWFRDDANALFSTKTYWVTGGSANIQENKAWNKVAFMASSLKTLSYAGEREVFFGPYGDERNPAAIADGTLQSTSVSSGNVVSCLQHRLTLGLGESVTFHVLLGAADKQNAGVSDPDRDRAVVSEANCIALIKKYALRESVDHALDAVKQYWTAFTSTVQVDTPCTAMNTYLNTWNQYQGKVTFLLSRNASYYHWGVTRGMGFRDSLQDTISVVMTEPDLVRARLLLLARYQRSDGVCAHCFHPVSGVAEFTGHKDDPLWLITATWYYLAETGDISVLEASAAFHDGVEATLLDHLDASVKFIDSNLGPNGIPTFGRGDWNDTLDFVGGQDGSGESVWVGMFYAYNLRLFADIMQTLLNDAEQADRMRAKYEAVRTALDQHAWDGEWYIRAACANGTKLGSSECREGRIYLNPQTWSVLSGVAGERGEGAMRAAAEHLDTEFGPKLLAPAYHEIDDQIGLITRCVWGKKENGSIFNHTTTWAIMAECMLGHGQRAMGLYEKLLPCSFDHDRYQIEPYVYAQYTTSDEHETFGQGSHAWLSGTAAWMFRAALDSILGIQVTLKGIRINPCVPSQWERFNVVRKYRGTTYRVSVVREDTDQIGVPTLEIDGEAVALDSILPQSGGDMSVVLTLTK
ncbi:MAG: glycosyl transferase family 36 [Lentisphaerae bacterium]|nr:glycosyl transferase family 36 [Lentisphaerota bacterium]